MLGSSIGINSVLLGVFALVTTGILALTNATTADRIKEAQLKAQLAALSEILSPDLYDNELVTDGARAVPQQDLPLLNLSEPENMYIATKNSQPVAVILPTNGEGYGGEIHMLVGIFADGTLAGVRVTHHAETPGLGDYIDSRKSDWILMFEGKSLSDPPEARWDVGKYDGDFDGLTSATISSRGVIHQVKKVLEYFATQQPLQTLATPAVATP